jgi:hypothetical protein
VSRRAKNAYHTPNFRSVERKAPSSPLSVRKGEGKRHVLSFGTFSWILGFLGYIRRTNKDSPPNVTKLADLHSSLRKIIRAHTSNTITRHSTIYGKILNEARTKGPDHTIHAYSTAPFRAKRDSLEVAWGVHIHRYKRKHIPTLICTKCQSPLTNTHILGGRGFIAKLRTKRHNSTF